MMKTSASLTSASIALLTALLFFSGCSVGPDFKKPAAPDTKGYVEDGTLPATTAKADTLAGAPQTFDSDKEIPAEWWKLYQSEPLNQLMEEALKASPDLQAAKASLKQAQENVYAGEGAFFPSVDANASVTRQKISLAAYGFPGGGSSIFTLYDGALSLSYGLDIFGYNRREVEELRAQADYQRYELEAAYLSLTTNIVVTAVQEASLREQIKQTEAVSDIERHELNILQKQLKLGAVPKSTVLAQQTILAQNEATLPPLQKALTQTENQLAVLAGRFPSQAWKEHFDIVSLRLPEHLPVSLPSKLVDDRPDIRAAEALLHAASAQVGVATAAMLPQITISAGYGVEASGFSQLGSGSAPVWNIGGGVLQPIFRGGTLLHERRAAVAAYDKALAQYKSVVLQAFGNVANTLRALQYDATGLSATLDAEKAAESNVNLAQVQFKAGAISYPQLLDAERAFAASRIGLAQAQAARLSDTAALFQSLGGGWWNKDQKATPSQTLSQTETK